MHETSEPIFLTIKTAALKTGLPYRVLLEAVNDGSVPHHRLGRSRRLLTIEEIVATMRSDQKGGA